MRRGAIGCVLRADGHDVLYIGETAAGLSDVDVIVLALRENRLLLTEDKDFGDLVFRRERTVPGVVLMRIGAEAPVAKAARLAAAANGRRTATPATYKTLLSRAMSAPARRKILLEQKTRC